MKIIHIDLTGPFTEKMSYQENIISGNNALDGHETYMISTCYEWRNNTEIQLEKEKKTLDNGVHLIRLPFSGVMKNKIRYAPGLYNEIENIQPDVIFLHCLQTASVLQILKYIKKHKTVHFYADSHTDFNNSAKGFISKYILHYLFYRKLAKLVLKYVKKIFYITYECKIFLNEMYGIPDKFLEYLPLGGTIISEEEYNRKRSKLRLQLGVSNNDIVLVHSGKMDKSKKTVELVKAFNSVLTDKIKLLIIGSFADDIRDEVYSIVKHNEKIIYLGWKDSDTLADYLCAGDLYIQPGTQSATMQAAICLHEAVALYPYESHRFLLSNAAFYIEDENSIKELLKNIEEDPSIVTRKRQESFEIARERLDYKKIARRIYK